MNLLRLCAYFPPEKVASSHLVDDAYKAYAKAEINCTCITPEPSRGVSNEVRKEYKNKRTEKLYDGYVTVKRFPCMKEGRNPIQRAFRYFVSAIKTYKYAVKEKDIDAVFVSSTPPIMGALGGMVGKKLSKKYGKKVPVVFNLQDIFPDSLVSAGMTKRDSLIWKIGRVIENYTYRNADKIIVISEGFKRNITEKGVPKEKIEIISNWIDMDETQPVSREDNTIIDEFGLDKNKFIAVYAGNFGEVQGAGIVLDAAEALKENKDIQFAIFGGGARFEEAKKRAEDMENVFIHSLLPVKRVPEVYSLGNVALITCKKGTGNSGLPSKTWSIMACNTPIIASYDADSDLGDAIRASGAGECVEAGNAEALTEAINRAYEAWKNREETEINLREYVRKNAEKNMCLDKYIEIFETVR